MEWPKPGQNGRFWRAGGFSWRFYSRHTWYYLSIWLRSRRWAHLLVPKVVLGSRWWGSFHSPQRLKIHLFYFFFICFDTIFKNPRILQPADPPISPVLSTADQETPHLREWLDTGKKLKHSGWVSTCVVWQTGRVLPKVRLHKNLRIHICTKFSTMAAM